MHEKSARRNTDREAEQGDPQLGRPEPPSAAVRFMQAWQARRRCRGFPYIHSSPPGHVPRGRQVLKGKGRGGLHGKNNIVISVMSWKKSIQGSGRPGGLEGRMEEWKNEAAEEKIVVSQ